MPNHPIMVFVCLHASAKSLIAMEYFNRLAAQRGSSLRALSAGPHPDDAVPPEIVAGLAADGFDVRGRKPLRLTPELLARAAAVVSFGPDVGGAGGGSVQHWDDMPAVSEDYATARDAIRARVARLFPEGSASPASQPKEELMTTDLDRRDFIGAGLTATGIATASLLRPEPAIAQAAPAAGRPFMIYEVKKLPFEPSRIKGMSEKLLVSHYENNYAGAVKRLNAIEAQLAQTDFATTPVFVINGLKREELIAANSMILHELFFDGLGGEGQPSGALAEAIARNFGSLERWKTEFAAVGKAEGGGSGWVLLAYSPRDKQLINTWAADHTTNLAGGRPILALDMYEHAYHMDYGAKAAAYVDAFMQVIRWDNAAKLYAKYSGES